MKKQNMIKMIQQYSAKILITIQVLFKTMSDVISFITGKVHSRDSKLTTNQQKKSKTNKTKRTRNSSNSPK